MLEQSPTEIQAATWGARQFHIVNIHPDRRYRANLFALEMEDGVGTKIVVNADDRELEIGTTYAYVTPDKTSLWDCGDGEPPDGEVVGSVINIIYYA